MENGTASDFHPALLTTFQFTFTVPSNHDHSTQVARATDKLIPGKTYEVKIFEITEQATSEICLEFLKTQKAILIGVQGIYIVWQQVKKQFPKGKWIIYFDEKGVLLQGADGRRRIDISTFSNGKWNWHLRYFGANWYNRGCLLCICDLSV